MGGQPGFMSTTLDKTVALKYAQGAHGMLFEIHQGLIDRSHLEHRCPIGGIEVLAGQSTPSAAFSPELQSQRCYGIGLLR